MIEGVLVEPAGSPFPARGSEPISITTTSRVVGVPAGCLPYGGICTAQGQCCDEGVPCTGGEVRVPLNRGLRRGLSVAY